MKPQSSESEIWALSRKLGRTKERKKEEERRQSKRTAPQELDRAPKLTASNEETRMQSHGIEQDWILVLPGGRFQKRLQKDIHLTNYRFTFSYIGTHYHG